MLEAFETLFNKKDYAAAERFWSPSYIQQSKHIPPGRDGLFGLIKSVPEAMRYENGAILAEENSADAARPHHWPRSAGKLDCGGHRASGERPSWPSIGTSSMTRPRARHPSAACRCSGRHFRWNDPAQLGSRIARQLKWTPSAVVCKGQSLGTVAGEKKMRNAQNGRIK